jgi:hypothetical protein
MEPGETGDVPSWQIYRLLNSGKPKNLPDDIWAKAVPGLINQYILRMIAVAQSASKWSDPGTIRKLLAVPKPIMVFDEKWNELQKDLGARYRTAVIARVLSRPYSSPADAFDSIQIAELDKSELDETRDWLRALYYAFLARETSRGLSPVEAINKADLKHLSPDDADALRAFAYQRQMKYVRDVCTPWAADQFLSASKPAFMSDDDYDRLTKLAKAVKKADEGERRYSALIANVRLLLKGATLASNPPPEISPDEWTNLKRIQQDFVQQNELAVLKARVLRQLDVINVFMNDPSVIDRIEEYETVFAPGNLSNLRRLAQQLRNSAKG